MTNEEATGVDMKVRPDGGIRGAHVHHAGFLLGKNYCGHDHDCDSILVTFHWEDADALLPLFQRHGNPLHGIHCLECSEVACAVKHPDQ